MDIKEIDLKTLKAMAYDEGVKIDQARQNLQVINAEIMAKIQDANKPKDVEVSKPVEAKKEDKK